MSVSSDLSKAIRDMEDTGDWDDVLPALRKALDIVVAVESIRVIDNLNPQREALERAANKVDALIKDERNLPRYIRSRLREVVLSA